MPWKKRLRRNVTSFDPHGPQRPRHAVTVAAVVERDGRFLIVEEDVRGVARLNQPAGHVESGECLLDALVRETREETGWRVRPSGLVAIYQWFDPASARDVLRFTFVAEALGLIDGATLDVGIIRTHWLSRDELLAHATPARTPLVLRSIDDYARGQITSLALVAHHQTLVGD